MEKIVVESTSSPAPIVQTPLYNLVVIGDNSDLESTVPEVTAAVPGISVLASASCSLPDGFGQSVLCSVAPDGKRTFCGEYTRISNVDKDEMAADISELLVSDVPTYLWLPVETDIAEEYPWLAPQVDFLIANEARKESVDRSYTFVDMSWLRLLDCFEAIAEVFDIPQALERIKTLTTVRITNDPKSTPGILSAQLMQGWLTYCLNTDHDGMGVHISADDSARFNQIIFSFNNNAAPDIVLTASSGIINVTGAIEDELSYPIRNDANILADQINGKHVNSVYNEVWEIVKQTVAG